MHVACILNKLDGSAAWDPRGRQSGDGCEGLRKVQQRQDWRLEKAVARSIQEGPALRRAEEEHKRKLVEIENDDGPRVNEAVREVTT